MMPASLGLYAAASNIPSVWLHIVIQRLRSSLVLYK
jgi:hypothetical protein